MNGTGCWPPSPPGSVTRPHCWTASCRRRSPTTRPPPGSTCFPAAASSGPAAAAPTTPTRASTRRRPVTCSAMCWTLIRSPCSCCAAGPGIRCWPGSGPAAGAPRQARQPASGRPGRRRRGRDADGGRRREPPMRAWTPGRRSEHRNPWRRSLPCRCRPAGPGTRPASGGSAALAIRPARGPGGAGRRRGQPGLGDGSGPVRRRRTEPRPGRRPGSPGSPGAGHARIRLARGALRARRTGSRPPGPGLAAGWPGRAGVAGRRVGPGRGRSGRRRLLAAAQAALRAKTDAAQPVIEGNRVTADRLQLRLGRDLRWYPYARSDDDWEPSGAPEADPARALEGL